MININRVNFEAYWEELVEDNEMVEAGWDDVRSPFV
jgi:hypothetical protein